MRQIWNQKKRQISLQVIFAAAAADAEAVAAAPVAGFLDNLPPIWRHFYFIKWLQMGGISVANCPKNQPQVE